MKISTRQHKYSRTLVDLQGERAIALIEAGYRKMRATSFL